MHLHVPYQHNCTFSVGAEHQSLTNIQTLLDEIY
jgi:hypothetical protein